LINPGGGEMPLTLTSPAFNHGEIIPLKYTCSGKDISPPLQWKLLPIETKSLVLIVDDPDAPVGTWVHWVIYDIPPNLQSLHENIQRKPKIENIGTQGINDFRKIGYGGPCPPPGKPHRYFFKLFALNTYLGLEPRITKNVLVETMRGRILAKSELIGIFRR